MPVITGQPIGKVGDPCVMVIFGASGDLTRRKLIPALYNLARAQLLSREFAVVGLARRPMSSEDYRKKVSEDMKQFATGDVDPDLWEWFVRRIYYLSGNFDDKQTYPQLKQLLEKIDKDHSTHGNYFYYLATAPDAFRTHRGKPVGRGLMEQSNRQWRRVIIEKPFGHDIESARSAQPATPAKLSTKSRFTGLITTSAKRLSRTSWRCGSPTGSSSPSGTGATSITSRFRLLKPSASKSAAAITTKRARCATWCRITSCNSSRLTAMEPPVSFQADAVRDEQAKILHAIQPFSAEEVLTRTVRGQYGEGVMSGQRVPALSRRADRRTRLPYRNVRCDEN